jgi:hypothetical protein
MIMGIYKAGDDESVGPDALLRLDCLDPVSETHQCWPELVADRNETVDWG